MCNRLILIAILCVSALTVFSCSNDLKQPVGSFSGTVFLDPEIGPGQNWAYINAHNNLYDVTVRSNGSTGEFVINDLVTEGYVVFYAIEIFRPGYFSVFDTLEIRAGGALINYETTIEQAEDRSFTLENGNGCKDTYISRPDTTSSHGLEPLIYVAGGDPDSISRGLLHFDFVFDTQFPVPESTDVQIDSATIELYIDSVVTDNSVSFNMIHLVEPYNEYTATWYSNGPIPWNGGIVEEPSTAPITLNQNSSGWITFNITPFVEHWLDDMAQTGMRINLINESNNAKIYIRSSGHSSVSTRPKMHIAISYIY